MNRVFNCLVTESAEELIRLERSTSFTLSREKIKMLYLIKTKQVFNKENLANFLSRNRNTVTTWISKYLVGGIKSLLKNNLKECGRKSKIHILALEKLEEILNSSKGFNSYKEIAILLRDKYFVTIAPKSLYYHLNKLKAKFKVARPMCLGQNKELFKAFKDYFPQVINSHILHYQKCKINDNSDEKLTKFKLWFQDESKFSEGIIQRRKITIRGVKPMGFSKLGHSTFYIYGLFSPHIGEIFCQQRAGCNNIEFSQYLHDFSESIKIKYPDQLNLIVLDRAPFHTSKGIDIPKNVRLVFLPAMSPELNPAERIWLEVKNKLAWEIQNLKEKEHKVMCELDKLESTIIGNQNIVRSIINYPYAQEAIDNLNNNNFTNNFRKVTKRASVSKTFLSLINQARDGIKAGRPNILSELKIDELIKMYSSKEYSSKEIYSFFGISRTTFYDIMNNSDVFKKYKRI